MEFIILAAIVFFGFKFFSSNKEAISEAAAVVKTNAAPVVEQVKTAAHDAKAQWELTSLDRANRDLNDRLAKITEQIESRKTSSETPEES